MTLAAREVAHYAFEEPELGCGVHGRGWSAAARAAIEAIRCAPVHQFTRGVDLAARVKNSNRRSAGYEKTTERQGALTTMYRTDEP
jgi:hypothetical protein